MMKKMLSLAAALLALAACTNDQEPGDAPAKYITVSASVGPMTLTRTVTDGVTTTFEPGDRISVYAWLGTADDAKQIVVNNSVNTLGGDGTWTASQQMMWANYSSAHYFLGIYPVQEVSDLQAMNFVLTPKTKRQATCFMPLTPALRTRVSRPRTHPWR